MILQPDYQPSVRKDGLLWVVDLADRPSQAKTPIAIEAPAKLASGTGISLSVADAGLVVTVKDPEVGDTMAVVPVLPVGSGIYPGRDTTDVNILQTLQGVALVPHIDDLDIRSSRSGVTIVRASGAPLTLSAVSRKGGAGQGSVQGFLDVVDWKGGDTTDFPATARATEDALANVAPSAKSKAHLEAARFFFANGYPAECLGYLSMAQNDEPTMADTGPFRALRGACEGLMGYWDQARQDLDNPLLAKDEDSQFWRAAAHAVTDPSPGQFAQTLSTGMFRLRDYPPRLATPVAGIIARVALKAGDEASARAAIDVLDKNAQSKEDRDWVNYLTGAYDELRGQFDPAIALYAKAEAGTSREARARAGLADTELQLKMKRISPAQAADRMDRMRFAWRDDEFEFALLKRLGELQSQAGEYPEALRTLRALTDAYSDRKDIGDVRAMMTGIFSKLYLDGAADSMAPVTAIGLYDEFRDLTPDGPQGDEMIRKLADRLAAVDLLDRASILLNYQVTNRLQGLDKAKVGTRLALLDILDKRPKDALAALTASTVDGIPPDLVLQRARLQARALADLGKPADAITAIAGDTSQEAGLLRAEIFWRGGDWANAALAFQALVPPPDPAGGKLTDDQARLVLSCAAALSMADDQRGLVAMARNYGPAMANTPLKDPFVLFTSPPDRQVTNMPGMATKIAQAQGFKTFIDSYKDKMKATGLSAIN
jgi:tetratricopeptide (TPR) repeat protein